MQGIDVTVKPTVESSDGFDSCTVPALINNPGTISLNSLDTCEGARWSAYISSDMKMMPCSFDNQDMRWAVDLRKFTIEEAWNSGEFEKFRTHFKISCPECGERTLCMGGCPIRPEIVLCDRKKSFQALTLLSWNYLSEK